MRIHFLFLAELYNNAIRLLCISLNKACANGPQIRLARVCPIYAKHAEDLLRETWPHKACVIEEDHQTHSRPPR